jgi:hypothetical protein
VGADVRSVELGGRDVIGKRVESHGELFDTPGSWMPVNRDGERTFLVNTPNGHVGDVSRHEVTEHEDGTITVSPSILVSDATGELWHGYLERGVWRSV